MNGITIDQINYLDNFSKNYTPEQLKLGKELIQEINDKKNKSIARKKNITPEIVKKYLNLFNSKELEIKKQDLLGESTNQSTPTTTINTGTIQHVPRVELQPIKESIRSSVEGESRFGWSSEKPMVRRGVDFRTSPETRAPFLPTGRATRKISERARASERVDTGKELPPTWRHSRRRASSHVHLPMGERRRSESEKMYRASRGPSKGVRTGEGSAPRGVPEKMASVRGSMRGSVAPRTGLPLSAVFENDERDSWDESDVPLFGHAGPPISSESSIERSSTEEIQSRKRLAQDQADDAFISERPPRTPIPELPLPDGWVEHWSDEGQKYYYYNTSTHESQWERPEMGSMRAAEAMPAASGYENEDKIDWKEISKDGKNYIYFIFIDGKYYIFSINEAGDTATNMNNNSQTFEMDATAFPYTYTQLKEIIRDSWSDNITHATKPMVDNIVLSAKLSAEGASWRDYSSGDEAVAREIAERDPFDPAGDPSLNLTQRSLYNDIQEYLRKNNETPETIFNVTSYDDLQKELQNNRITQEQLAGILDLRLYIGMKLEGVTQIPDDLDEKIKYANTAISFLEEYNVWIQKRYAMAEEAAQRFSHRGTGVRGHSAAAAAAAALSTSAPEPRASAAAASALRTSEPAARASAPVSRASAPAAARVSDRGIGVRGYSAPVRRVFIGQANELSRLIEINRAEEAALRASSPPPLPPKPTAGLGSPSPAAAANPMAQPLTASLPTSPTSYIWLFDPDGGNYASVTIRADDVTGTNFNIIGSFEFNKKIKSFFIMLEAQQKFGLELIQSQEFPHKDHTIIIPISQEEYKNFLENILSEEHPWNIKTSRGVIKLPGFWFRTKEEAEAMMAITQNFNFIEIELGKLKVKCETLTSQQKNKQMYDTSSTAYRFITADPTGSIEKTKQGIKKNMDRVIKAERDINETLRRSSAHLQSKYNDKCKNRLDRIKRRIQSMCDRSVILRPLMTEEAASSAAASSAAENDLIGAMSSLILSMPSNLTNLQRTSTDQALLGQLQKDTDTINVYMQQLSASPNLTQQQRKTIQNLTGQYDEYMRRYHEIIPATVLSSSAVAMGASAAPPPSKPLPQVPLSPISQPGISGSVASAVDQSARGYVAIQPFLEPPNLFSAVVSRAAPQEQLQQTGQQPVLTLLEQQLQQSEIESIMSPIISRYNSIEASLKHLRNMLSDLHRYPENSDLQNNIQSQLFPNIRRELIKFNGEIANLKGNYSNDTQIQNIVSRLMVDHHKLSEDYERMLAEIRQFNALQRQSQSQQMNQMTNSESGRGQGEARPSNAKRNPLTTSVSKEHASVKLPPPVETSARVAPEILIAQQQQQQLLQLQLQLQQQQQRQQAAAAAAQVSQQVFEVPILEQGSPIVASPLPSPAASRRQSRSSGRVSSGQAEPAAPAPSRASISGSKPVALSESDVATFLAEYDRLAGLKKQQEESIRQMQSFAASTGSSYDIQIKQTRDNIVQLEIQIANLIHNTPNGDAILKQALQVVPAPAHSLSAPLLARGSQVAPAPMQTFSSGPGLAYGMPGVAASSRSGAAAAPAQNQPEPAEELTRQFTAYLENITHYSGILKILINNPSVAEPQKSEIKTRNEKLLQDAIQNASAIQQILARRGITVQMPKSEFLPPAPPPSTRAPSSRSSFVESSAAAAAQQRARETSPPRSSGTAAKQSGRSVSPTFKPSGDYIIIDRGDSITFNFDTRPGKKAVIPDPLMPDAEVIRLHDEASSLKTQESNLRENLKHVISEYNKNNNGMNLTVQELQNGAITFNLPSGGSKTAEGKKLFNYLRTIGTELHRCLNQLKEKRGEIDTRTSLFMMGGSRRSSHLAKHKHKNKTKHKHNYNHKARPNRKNNKTIKKYRGMSRMPTMPSAPKQKVVSYRKHKKTTRKYKATRHAKMNKNKPKNSNKKSRKFRR